MRRFRAFPNCSKAVAIGVLAHELAHHFYGDAFAAQREDRIAGELRADYFAGVALARAGVAPFDLERVLVDISSCCGLSHPSRGDRVRAIRTGYTNAG